jgi:hypothetical protein
MLGFTQVSPWAPEVYATVVVFRNHAIVLFHGNNCGHFPLSFAFTYSNKTARICFFYHGLALRVSGLPRVS